MVVVVMRGMHYCACIRKSANLPATLKPLSLTDLKVFKKGQSVLFAQFMH
jgi:hypothetical protein